MTQVWNYWFNQAWEKYKAVHKRQEHTGGGDGDADRSLDLDADDSAADGDDLAVDGSKPKWTKKVQFSPQVLDNFENSWIFKLIDVVYVTIIYLDDIH